MASAILIEGIIIGIFVIINGGYTILYPPLGDEPGGYAIVLVGLFIILAGICFDRQQQDEKSLQR